VDATQAPEIVMVAPEACADRMDADRQLRVALAPASAPRAGWTVTTRIEATGTGLRAEGTVTDEAGAPVGHRALSRAGRECAPLARGVGVWAALVLDAALDRAQGARPPSAAPAGGGSSGDVTFWPAPMPAERPSAESQTFLAHPERHDLELGVGGFLMSTQAFGVVAGAGATVVVEVPGGWFLRPGFAAGRSAASADGHTLWATHMGACKRIPGNYIQRRGIQADFCLDSDLGLAHREGLRPALFASLGPALGLRGELGGALSVEVRGLGGWMLAQSEALARVELGMTWRLR
jgi:hypothetical protein